MEHHRKEFVAAEGVSVASSVTLEACEDRVPINYAFPGAAEPPTAVLVVRCILGNGIVGKARSAIVSHCESTRLFVIYMKRNKRYEIGTCTTLDKQHLHDALVARGELLALVVARQHRTLPEGRLVLLQLQEMMCDGAQEAGVTRHVRVLYQRP